MRCIVAAPVGRIASHLFLTYVSSVPFRWGRRLIILLTLAFPACELGESKGDAGANPDGAVKDVSLVYDAPTDQELRDADDTEFVCNVVAPTECLEPAPRYADVAPILLSRCVICHYGAFNGPWPLSDYQHVADWRDFVRDEILNCSMPPLEGGVVMSNSERKRILEWIRCGLLK